MKKLLPFLVVAGVVGLLAMMWYFAKPRAAYANLDAFAACLRDKQVTMYGTYSCPYCKAQKAMFGSAFKAVPYVECTAEPQRCTAAGVEKVPAWIFPGGKRLQGLQQLETLSSESGCALPNTSGGGV